MKWDELGALRPFFSSRPNFIFFHQGFGTSNHKSYDPARFSQTILHERDQIPHFLMRFVSTARNNELAFRGHQFWEAVIQGGAP
jgi:hypothetical protein